MKIRDLVSLNREGNFATAIDLTAFRSHKENANLCASFCFARLDQEPVFGSWDWLRMVSRGLALGNRNIWSLTANYGHGKTHFGVVLANYLGQAWDSSELKTIHEKLEAVSNRDFADQILSLRERKQRPYFTLCLQGHQMPTLRQAVFQEVERELRRHEASQEYAPPLWQAMAVKWLDQLDAEKTATAREWADQRGRDLGDIRKALEDRDPRAEFRHLLDELAAHVMKGFPPNFGHQTTLRQLLDQIYVDLCGREGHFSGIAIIFDEFHVYVDAMARHPQSGDSLQDLLEAVLVPDRVASGSAIFVALGTMDPNEAARRSIGTLTPDNPIAKQLNRIPDAGSRFILRSELETVLDGLLKQNDDAWATFGARHTVAIRDATLVTYEAFRKRFDELKWNATTVSEKITKGAFPLHPITTQLISNLDFQVVQNPRGVLDFVKDQFNRYADDDAERDDRPNWIVANELYEPFAPMLKPELRQRVAAALDSLGGDSDETHERVLAAMTLISAGSLPTPPAAGGYARLVSEIADMDLSVAQDTLDDLVSRGIINFERLKGAYRFFTGASRAQFETALRAVRGSATLDTLSISSLTSLVARANASFVSPRTTNVEWGYNGDWTFTRYIVTRSQIESGHLKVLSKLNDHLTANGTKGWTRALEFVFLPVTADDADWIRKEGGDLLRQSFSDIEEPPVMIAYTANPATEVVEGLIDLVAAEAISADDRARLKDQYVQGVDQLQKRLKEAIDRYSRENFFRLVAPALKPTYEAVASQSLDVIGVAILGRVYRQGPRKFLTSNGLTSTSHVSACAKLAGALLGNKVDAVKASEPNGPAMTIAERFLRDSWGMIGNDYLLRSPTEQRILDVWAELNDEFPAGSPRELGRVLRKLVNPPYGFDTCTLVLAVCGWLGNQGREVQLWLDGQPASAAKIQGDQKMPTLLGNLLQLRIKREDVGELNQRAQALITRIESGSPTFTRSEADEAIKVLEGYGKDPLEGWESRAEQALAILKSHREGAKLYSEVVAAASQPMNQPSRILERLEAVKLLNPGLVNDNWPSPEQLRDAFLDSLNKLWSAAGDQQSQIKSLEDYSQRKQQLEALAGKSQDVGATGFANAVHETIKKLDFRKKELATASEQKGFASELRGFPTKHASLVELRQALAFFGKQAQELAPLAADTQAKLEAKLTEVKAEIDSLIDADAVIRQRLEAAITHKAVEGVSRYLEVITERLQGTAELQSIEKIAKHVDRVLQLFKTLEGAEKRPSEKRTALQKEISQAALIAESGDWPEALKAHARKVETQLKGIETARVRSADKEFERNERLIEARSTTIDTLEELRRFFAKPSEFLSSENSDRAPVLVQEIEVRLAVRSVERIKSIAGTLHDRAALLELSEFLRQLADSA